MIDRRQSHDLAVVILAAGKGTRMNSHKAKVLHPICGKPMILFPVAAARELGAEKIVIVVGHQADEVKDTVGRSGILYALQREQLGTGHAVLQAKEALSDFQGTVMILCGDVPLLKPSTLKAFWDSHRQGGTILTILTVVPPDPGGYGRIVKDEQGGLRKIVEERDADKEEKRIEEINTGIYCVEASFLFEALGSIKSDNAQDEYYLTDIVAAAVEKNLPVGAYRLDDHREAMGINTPAQLKEAEGIMSDRRHDLY